jgi:ribose-phosphate pyrophosphokinase
MKYLNLDPEFTPYGKGIAFESFTFKGGEPHLKITEELTPDDEVLIIGRSTNFEEFGRILLAADAIKRFDVKRMEAFIPYFPAARQDRVMVPGEPLSVKVYADMVNMMQFDKVYVYDAHSEVTPALITNCQVIPNHKFVQDVTKNITGEFVLVSPDGGALKKIFKLSKALGGIEVVEASKKRDVRTGKLSSFHVYEDDLKGKTCIVVDDICDGGGTFLGLGEQLKAKGAGDLYLVASHGIFSRGIEHLKDMYAKIISTDSFSTRTDEGLTQVKLDAGNLEII